MPIMSNRIFLPFALLLTFAVTSAVCSYNPYGRYGPPARDQSFRQVRRCPTCPADCPESLASPWYGSPTVYGQPPPFQRTTENFAASYSAPSPRAEPLTLYGNQYYPYENSRCRCSHGGCNARSPRSEKVSNEGQDDVANRFDSVEPRGTALMPYTSYTHRASPLSSFVPETYREMDDVVSTENHRIGRHFGNAYKDTIPDQTTGEESLGSGDSLPREQSAANTATAAYENTERVMAGYEGRLKAVETPSRKKVFVVYRADADETIDDDDLDRSLIATSRQLQNNINDHQSSIYSGSSTYPMTDSQLEELVRRAVAAVTRQNINRDPEQTLYNRLQPRGINYNEHQRNPEESYNPRRPYNDEIYQRFNAEEVIDREENRKPFTTGSAPSEVVYTPTMRYNPYAFPANEYQENISPPSQSILEDNQRYNAPWQAQQISNVGEQDVDEYTNQSGQETILEESREVSQEEVEDENQQEEQKSFETTQDFTTAKRETDFETLSPPPINYRTHSRTTEAEQIEEQQDKTSEPLENNTEQDDQAPPIAINPDLIEDMEIPPIEGSEVELQLSFESLDNTTPSPTN